jgi:hypothetical protein
MAANDPGSLTSFAQAATPSTAAPTNLTGGPGIQSLTPQEMETPTKPDDKWSDTYAAKIAMEDFKKMEAYRSQNHDWRFKTSDQLYLAYAQRKTWEGTKIPRSSLGIFIALEQIEAMLPVAIGALFPDNCRLPFEAEPNPGTTQAQAQAVEDLISSQLGDLGEPQSNLTLREICRRGYKSSLTYGHAPVEFGVLDRIIYRTHFVRQQIPVRQLIPHPLTGEPVPVPTGQMRSTVQESLVQQHVVRPMLANVDVRDFYWDPNCSSPNVNSGAMCATRHLIEVSKLLEYQGVDGFNIPSETELYKLAKIKSSVQGDTTKSNQESMRGMTYNPNIDYSADPANARVEVIRYWQKWRHVWVFGRQWTAYNRVNRYGMLPFLNAFYVDVPGRFAGLSICDLVEGDQKLAEAIINARIDELNLLIHPPIIKKQGRGFSASQQRLRPGVIWEAEDPKNDYVRFEMGNVTAQSYTEVDALERRVQKKTGITDLAVLGTPSAGGNSANRTATGVSSQDQASGKRIQYHVENAEDQFITPLLGILLSLNQLFLPMDEMIQVLGKEAQFVSIDPLDVINAEVKFKMNASSKMRARSSMASGGLGLVLQTYLNPEVIQMAMQQGKKIDFEQVERLVNDTFGMSPNALWIDATPEDAQNFIQMKMMPEQMKRTQQQDRLQSHERTADNKDETTLVKALLEKILTPDVAHKLINELTGSDLTLPSDQPPAQPAAPGGA